jgi:ribosomal protein L37E
MPEKKKGYLYQHRMENSQCIYCGYPEIPMGDTWQDVMAAKCPVHRNVQLVHGEEHTCPTCGYSARFKVDGRIWCSYCDMEELMQQWKQYGVKSLDELLAEDEDEPE